MWIVALPINIPEYRKYCHFILWLVRIKQFDFSVLWCSPILISCLLLYKPATVLLLHTACGFWTLLIKDSHNITINVAFLNFKLGKKQKLEKSKENYVYSYSNCLQCYK
jgi:hypothetical protein